MSFSSSIVGYQSQAELALQVFAWSHGFHFPFHGKTQKLATGVLTILSQAELALQVFAWSHGSHFPFHGKPQKLATGVSTILSQAELALQVFSGEVHFFFDSFCEVSICILFRKKLEKVLLLDRFHFSILGRIEKDLV